MPRRPGMSVRLKLTLTYAGVVILTGAMLLTVVWLFLLRYVPNGNIWLDGDGMNGRTYAPNQSDLVRAFIPPTAAMLIVLVLIGLIGGWFLAGRMLRPLDRLHEAAQLAADGSLSHRIRLKGPRDEFHDLADVFDRMLAQLERHVGEQQRFAANASHELRTPLATAAAMLDVAASDPQRDADQLIERLRTVNTRAIDLTESLLLLAKTEGGTQEHASVDLSLLAEDAIETLEPFASRRGIVFDTDLAPAGATGSPALLQQLATNLVHNAIVHNLPTGGGIAVRTRQDAQAAELTVGNTGAVIDETTIATLTEPFQRGQRTTEHGEGVGLGLAIVASIVRAHDGTLVLQPLSGGGLAVIVRLPR
ncbi:HAMP domain-containing sensor histidine kinase [Microbacterium sp.]|uniref:sensor histidine kinase n=1 Tax=Microbacterium sp. TaxID=51671 RepID=UPI00334181FC